jgi:hypothetical protein
MLMSLASSSAANVSGSAGDDAGVNDFGSDGGDDDSGSDTDEGRGGYDDMDYEGY